MDHPVWVTFGIWVAAFLTLGIMSFLYRDNPMYKFCEALFVGLSAGYWFVSYYFQNLLPHLIDPLGAGLSSLFGGPAILWSNFLSLVPALLGLMMLLRLVPKIGWISRWPLAFVVGFTAGLRLITFLQSNAMTQLQNSVEPVVRFSSTGSFQGWDSFNTLLVTVGTFCGLFYFFFSKEHKGVFGHLSRVGTWFLMITFGAAFGYTVMGRMSLLIGRIDFLFGDWMHLVH
ncbi:MAG: hypothetical protein HY304_01520 [candidate division Zixibacteria bacterium]|nr:hypothetical protein [candidate division Zixibacteria bacterium]